MIYHKRVDGEPYLGLPDTIDICVEVDVVHRLATNVKWTRWSASTQDVPDAGGAVAESCISTALLLAFNKSLTKLTIFSLHFVNPA